MSEALEKQIDREYLADISGGDTEFEQELVEAFIGTAGDLVTDLEHSLQSGSDTGVRHSAHTLKGSSRAIGANPFSDVCEVIEMAARAGDLTTCQRELPTLKDGFAVLGEACRAFLAEAA